MSKILITGGLGFIGRNLCLSVLENYKDEIVIIDKDKANGMSKIVPLMSNYYDNLKSFDPEHFFKRVKIVEHDLNYCIPNYKELYNIDLVINLASESSVEKSIKEPEKCWKNNCNSMINVLEWVRQAKPRLFIHVSTDEVYGDCFNKTERKENSEFLPSNPYSASKAAQECLAYSYHRTYKIPTVILNLCNCVGKGQDKEKFVPKIISKLKNNETIQIYSNGVRDYIAVETVSKIITDVIRKFYNNVSFEKFNVSKNNYITNYQLAQKIAGIMNVISLIESIDGNIIRPGYDIQYKMDGSALTNVLYNGKIDSYKDEFYSCLEKTVNWSLKYDYWL